MPSVLTLSMWRGDEAMFQGVLVKSITANLESSKGELWHWDHSRPPLGLSIMSFRMIYIITLLDSGISGAQIHDTTSFGSVTISCIYSQYHFNFLKFSGDHPAKLTIANIDYVRCIIYMGKVNNALEFTRALQNITNTPISSQTVHHQLS